MMTTYFYPLLSIIALCAFWAIFQVWLSKHDPDATKSSKCGGCGRRDECSGSAANREETTRK